MPVHVAPYVRRKPRKGRHRFTTLERKRGTIKALASRKTPKQLKPGLRKYAILQGWI